MTRALAVLAALVVLTACGSDDQDPPSSDGQSTASSAPTLKVTPTMPKPPVGEPKTLEAAVAMAEEQAEAYSSGDYGGAWDMWVDEAKALLSREDYIAVGKECDLGGIPLEVKGVRLEGDSAVVRIGLGDILTTYMPRYQDGEWRWQPNDETMEQYASGKEGTIKALRDQGNCDN